VRRLAYVLSILSIGTSCGGHSAAPSLQPVSEVDFPEAYAEATCDLFQTCCSRASLAFDHAACITAALQYAGTYLIPAAVAHVYDASKAGECLARLRAFGTSCTISGNDENALENVCSELVTGVQPLGESCASTKACAKSDRGNVICRSSPTSGDPIPPMAVCALEIVGQVGDRCLGPSPPLVGMPADPRPYADRCADGLYCDATSNCAAALAIGQACSFTSECGPDRACDVTTRQCILKKADGTPCAGNGECASGTCRGDTCIAGEPIGTEKNCTVQTP
jgi:hypothetical protein